MFQHRSFDLFVVITITIIALALTFVTPVNLPVRILTFPLVFVLPGYALTCAMFNKRALGVPERLVFSLGLSLIVVILGGLALNLTPLGLRANSWASFLGGISLGASIVALILRRGQDKPASRWSMKRLTFLQGLLLVLAGLIICGAATVSINGASQQSHAGFTQLWILPATWNHRP